jgi:hypothetical protein
VARITLVLSAATASVVAQQRPQPLLDGSGHVREDAYIPSPLPASERAYADIDGGRMKAAVNEIVAISRKSRDDGNKYWGRIAGTKYEAMTADLIDAKFRKLGLQDINRPEFALAPQWFATDWDMSAVGGGKTLTFTSLRPALGSPATLKMRLQTEMRPNLKSISIYGTLPGTTDEDILVMAHMDGWFDAALDNASGLSTMLALAEHFAKVPKEKRRRTIIFIGTAGHHVGSPNAIYLRDKRADLLAKTALMINAEHVSVSQTLNWNTTLRATTATGVR